MSRTFESTDYFDEDIFIEYNEKYKSLQLTIFENKKSCSSMLEMKNVIQLRDFLNEFIEVNNGND